MKMTWEEMKKNLVFSIKRASEAEERDKAFWLGFFNALEMIAYAEYRDEYVHFTAERLKI